MANKFKDRRDTAFVGALARGIAVEEMTRGAVAEKANVSYQTLNNWCKHPGHINLGSLRILAREMQFSDDEIISMVR